MLQQEFLDLFLQLIRIDGVSLQERQVADYIIGKFNQWHIPVQEDGAAAQLQGTAGNLIVRIPGNDREERSLLLLAHMDTVASTAAVHPVIENDVIRSDGSTILGVDNRAGVALILHMVGEILEKQINHRSLEIVFTVAEELGMLGALALDFSRLQARQGYVFDCTAVPGGYVASTPTAYDFKIDFKGRPAHSAVAPEKGINALAMALHVMNAFPVGRVNANTVANIGTIHGGSADNVVPDHVAMTGEFRCFNTRDVDLIREDLQASCYQAAKQWGGACEPVFTLSFQGFQFFEQMPLVRRLCAAYGVCGVSPNPLVYYGGSDANIFNARGIEVINVGIGAQNPHAKEEHIDLKDVCKAQQVLMQLIKADDR